MTLVPYPPSHPVIRSELAAMSRAAKRINRSPESARAYLVKRGFVTPNGRLTKQYGG